MSDIGPFTTNTSFALEYSRPNGPDIEVDVEVSGVLYCDDQEYGVEARDITAKIIERELTDDEIDALDLEQVLTEHFCDSEPSSPRPGSYYKSVDGFVWKVVDTFLTWGSNRDRYVLIERFNFTFDFRGPTEQRRLVPLHEFAFAIDDEGKQFFQWTPNEKSEQDKLRPA